MAETAQATSKIKLDPIGKLFRDAWRLFEGRFGEVVWIFAIPAAIIALSDIMILLHGRIAVAGEIVSLVGVVASLVAGIALIAAIGRRISFGDAYRTGFSLFWPFIWMCILVFFTIAGGFVLLVVPGIFLLVALSFTNYVFVLEGKRGMAALRASREYTRGYWWAIFGRALLLVAVFWVIVAVLDAPFAALGLATVGAIVYALLLVVFTPFSISYTFTIYENLRRPQPGAVEASSKLSGTFFKICIAAGIIFIVIMFIASMIFGLSQVQAPGTGGTPSVAPSGQYPSSPT